MRSPGRPGATTPPRRSAPAPGSSSSPPSRPVPSSDMPGGAAHTPPDRFEGFADRDGRFFRALARNQRREWFAAHQQEYEEGWHAPMKALLGEVRECIDPFFPHLPLGEPKVFRIYRDVRFSKDKAPYKTHIGGYVYVEGGRHGPAAAAVPYVHIGANEVYVGGGQYMMDPPQLARFREALLDDRRGAALAAILKKLTRAGYAVGS